MHLQLLYVQSNNKQFNLNLLIFLNLINKFHADFLRIISLRFNLFNFIVTNYDEIKININIKLKKIIFNYKYFFFKIRFIY